MQKADYILLFFMNVMWFLSAYVGGEKELDKRTALMLSLLY